ncbi:MAG: hypothetical protein LCH84_18150 [Gemmatimonadetes bacterium]|nr:hypothetical protein [Gemmatimonadota bacterium]
MIGAPDWLTPAAIAHGGEMDQAAQRLRERHGAAVLEMWSERLRAFVGVRAFSTSMITDFARQSPRHYALWRAAGMEWNDRRFPASPRTAVPRSATPSAREADAPRALSPRRASAGSHVERARARFGWGRR